MKRIPLILIAILTIVITPSVFAAEAISLEPISILTTEYQAA